MKYLIILTLATISIGVFSKSTLDDRSAKEMQIGQICLQESKANPNDFTEGVVGRDNFKQEVKCFYSCVTHRLEYLKADGTINPDPFLPLDAPEIVKQDLFNKLATCADLNKDDGCDSGMEVFKCLISRMKKNNKQNKSRQ